MSEEFLGFPIPEQNWFRLPNCWTDITAKITSLAELKVIEYVLRHTWGYQEYEVFKHITFDEFENGRKRKDGIRLDCGIGLSRHSIVDGVKRAIEHGFLEAILDSSDGGRSRKLYRLKMLPKGRIFTPDLKILHGRIFNPEVQNLGAGGVESTPRTEKETKGKTPTLKDKSLRVGAAKRPVPTKPSLLDNGDFDIKAGGRLREILILHDSDLVQSPRRVRVDTLARSIKSLRIERSVSEVDIKKMLKWMKAHYSEPYVPKMRKADDLFANWGRFREAKTRWEHEQGMGEDGNRQLVDRVLYRLWKTGEGPFDQKEIDVVLKEMGEPAGKVTEHDL